MAAASADGRLGREPVPDLPPSCAEYAEQREPTDAELWGLEPNPGSDPPAGPEADVPSDLLVALLAGNVHAGTGFAEGGVLDELEPGVVLAGFAQDAQAAGLDALCDDELIGVVRAFRRLASWATAGEFAAVHELSVRRDREAETTGEDPILAVASTEAELACALTLTQRGAQTLLDRAGDLARLPGTAAALAAGVIDDYRARIIAEQLSELDAEDAQRVETKLLEKAGAQTSGQLRAAALRAVFAVDPAAVRKRQEKAQRDARVEVWREPSGTASIAGRDLPPAEVLAADKRIDALAKQLKKTGAEGSLDQLRAQVYTALLTGMPLDELLVGSDSSPAGLTAARSDPATRRARWHHR